MKKNILMTIALTLVVCTSTFGQDKKECEKIASLTFEAIKGKSTEPILKYLSDDFKIAGQSGDIAKMILSQLFTSLSFTEVKKINDEQTDVLTINYQVNFDGIGEKKSTFIFNKDNQLRELELLKVEVKTMKNDTKVIKNDFTYFSVPFKMAGNLILVEAKVNGIVRNFIVDNGAPKLIFNNKHESREGDTLVQTLSNASGANGTISNMNIEKVSDFDFAGIKLSNQDVLTMDLAHLEEELKTDVYGLIGYEIYKDYDMLFDYAEGKLTFINPTATMQYLASNFTSNQIIEVPIEMNKHLAFLKAVIDNNEYKFGLDCGAESNLINSELFNSIKNQCSKIVADTLVGADKNMATVNSCNLKLMQIEAINFEDTKVIFGDVSILNKGYGLNADGLIGYEILSRQKTLLSYANKKILFIK